MTNHLDHLDDGPDLDAEWHADRLAHRINLVRAARPVRLSQPGELHPDVAAWADALVAGRAGNLVLISDVGVGKTWSAWEALERAARNGWGGTWVFAAPDEWQDAVTPPEDRDLLTRMRTVNLLILDDLGSIRITDWQRDRLSPLIDHRWRNARPTVITTNLPNLKDPLGDRIASRLADGATVVTLDGPDRRRNR